MGDGALVEFASAVDCHLRHRNPKAASGARRRCLRSQSDPVPDRDQRWRCHHRGRRHPWRRRQYRGTD
jgi:hypothetical protein